MSNNFPYGSNDSGFVRSASTEIDYGDIPDNMNEQEMRAYLTLESKLVMPNHKKRDSFEQQWNDGRSKYDNKQEKQKKTQPKPQSPQSPQQPQNSNVGFVPPPPQNMNFAFQKKQTKPAVYSQQPTNQAYKPQYNNSNNTNNMNSISPQRYRNDTNTTNTTNASSVYPDSDYQDTVVDRMSTVTIISQKGKHKRQHSFKKHEIPQNIHNQHHEPNGQNNANLPPLNQSNPNNATAHFPYNGNTNAVKDAPHNTHTNNMNMNGYTQPKSALTAQIAPQKHHLANQNSGKKSGVIQSRNGKGLLVVKQVPYSKKTHVCLNIYVEIKPDHVEHIIVYFQKHFSVKQFLALLKNETNNAAFCNAELQIFCADEGGDLDDDFPAPETNAIIANFGIKHFYIKLTNELSDEQRNEIRRTTIQHKSQLSSEEQMDKIHNINDYEYDEDEDEYEEEDEGCKCIIL